MGRSILLGNGCWKKENPVRNKILYLDTFVEKIFFITDTEIVQNKCLCKSVHI